MIGFMIASFVLIVGYLLKADTFLLATKMVSSLFLWYTISSCVVFIFLIYRFYSIGKKEYQRQFSIPIKKGWHVLATFCTCSLGFIYGSYIMKNFCIIDKLMTLMGIVIIMMASLFEGLYLAGFFFEKK